MTIGQVTYPTKPGTAFAGMLVDLTDNDVVSLVNTEPSGAIPFGVAIGKGADENKGILPATLTNIRGVAVHSHAYDNAALASNLGVPAKDMINVLRRGRVWAICEDGCVPDNPVFVRIAANGGNTQLGALRATDDGANAGALAGAVWKTTATAGNLAIIEVSLLGSADLLT